MIFNKFEIIRLCVLSAVSLFKLPSAFFFYALGMLQILDSFQDQSQCSKDDLGEILAWLASPKLGPSKAALPPELSHSTQDIQLYKLYSKYIL